MKVLLLDAYNLIYRARSGYLKGEYPVVYNFFRGVRPLIEKFSPDKVYFVLEGNPQFRKNLNDAYKANRSNNDRHFHEQKAQIISIVKECLVEILSEGINSKDPSQLMGRTRTNRLTFFDKEGPNGKTYSLGELVQVKINDARSFSLTGNPLT